MGHLLGGYWPDAPQNATADALEKLIRFANASGVRLILDLNELHGRDCHQQGACEPNCTCTGDWDSSNAEALLTWLHNDRPDLGALVYAFELGNELTRSGTSISRPMSPTCGSYAPWRIASMAAARQ